MTGKIITHGIHSYFEPSSNGRYAELKAKQQAQLQKLALNKKQREKDPSAWEKQRDLKVFAQALKQY